MTLDDISRLVSQFEDGTALSLEYTAAGSELHLQRRTAARTSVNRTVTTTAVVQTKQASTIAAPACGAFSRSHPLSGRCDDLPRIVSRGDLVACLRIGSLVSGVPAPADGTLISQLVEDGAVVGHATPLFEFAPDR